MRRWWDYKMEVEYAYIERVKKVYTSRSRVYIYGAGKVAGIIFDLCVDSDIPINGFCVTELMSNVSRYKGLPVVQFDTLQDENTIILIGFLEYGEKKIERYIRQTGKYIVVPLPDDILLADKREMQRRNRPAMEITPIIGCKINCRYCPQKKMLNAYFRHDKLRKSKMTFEEFKICLGKLPQNTLIEFAGFVEPFLNEESVDMMLYANEVGYEMTLFTTLVGLTEDNFKRIRHIPFKQVILHTADERQYANIKVDETYLNLLKTVVDAKKADGTPFVDGANCQSKPHAEVLKVSDGRLKIYCELQDRAGNLLPDSEVVLSGASKKGRIFCERARNVNHNVLLPDGTVALCCNDFGLEYVLGNLFVQSYEDIVNGEEMKRITNYMKNDSNESAAFICRKCIYAHTY